MPLLKVWLCALLSLLAASAGVADTLEQLAQQVREAETGFAATMADRNLEAFGSYVADDAIFFDGDQANRGKQAVVAAWTPLYAKPQAPFSWQSRTVEVLADGTLAHSSGPVFDPQGRQVGTFNSIWRREHDGRWRVIFDKGCSACRCNQAAPSAEH